jgi:hypothetical protein
LFPPVTGALGVIGLSGMANALLKNYQVLYSCSFP